ncbi:hypothetical protein [Candidatus Mycobacterium methanotrophicum]|uniref:hypothetical protein n=1 Tax=Candidatus Mycobacterium methanotrophicum TaxID=2943498 RepID=UPI001C57D463|nr:hypothetical protein [Candidatus Mycobacterium methanotrophicum]
MRGIRHTVEDRRLITVECPLNTERVVLSRAGGLFRPVRIVADWSTHRVDSCTRHIPIYTLTGPRILKSGLEGRSVCRVFSLTDAEPHWITDCTDRHRPSWAMR